MNVDSRPKVPEALAARVLLDLRPVRPLLSSEVRTLVVVALTAVAATLLLTSIGVRRDLFITPSGALFGMVAVRFCASLILILLAFRESIPGSPRSSGTRIAATAIGFGVLLLLPVLFAWIIGPRRIVSTGWPFCSMAILAVSLPSLAATIRLITSGYPLRPVLAGFLAGLGCGALAEAVQFMACNITTVFHGSVMHGGAAIGIAVSGALAGWLVEVRRRRDYSF